MEAVKNIIGLWSEEIDSYEGTHIAFHEDGMGLLSWALLDNGILDTFKWTLENGVLSIEGVNKYFFENMRVVSTEKSDISLKSTNILFFKEERRNGEEVDAFEFSEPICEDTSNLFRLFTRNISDLDYYTELEKAILEVASKDSNTEQETK